MKGNDAVFEEMNKVLRDAFNEISEIADEAFNNMNMHLQKERELMQIESQFRREYLSSFWIVPQSIIKHHQVIDKKPMFSHIRNNI